MTLKKKQTRTKEENILPGRLLVRREKKKKKNTQKKKKGLVLIHTRIGKIFS